MSYINSLRNVIKDNPLANLTISDIHSDIRILQEACGKAEKYDKKEKGVLTVDMRCGNCKHYFDSSFINYCPICGYKIKRLNGRQVKIAFIDEVKKI